jgi:enoyl-CoA hydratase
LRRRALREDRGMNTLPLLSHTAGGVLTLTLNRPAARNALSPELLCRLADALQDFAANDSLRVAVLTGAGELAFCAGGDLGLTLPLLTGARPPADAWDARVLNDPLVMAASGLRDWPLAKPVVAAVNGVCLAAGAELLLGTDIRITAEHASFGWPEVRRAVLPFAGSMARLPRQVGHAAAMQLLLTGQPISAAEALRIGLVNEVLPAAEVLPRAQALARQIASNGPLAVQAVKRTVLACSGQLLDAAFHIEDVAWAAVAASADAQEGPRAFIEKRAPVWRGR